MIESMLEGVAVINEQGVIEITNPPSICCSAIGAASSSVATWRSSRAGRTSGRSVGNRCRRNRAVPCKSSSTDRRADDTHFAALGVLSRFEVAGRNQACWCFRMSASASSWSAPILQAVSREQYRIGNDLHDGLGQELTGIALMLRGLAGRLTTEYPSILPEIEGHHAAGEQLHREHRALARGLSPVNLERGGLSDALEEPGDARAGSFMGSTSLVLIV